jgi:hypothetical protein
MDDYAQALEIDVPTVVACVVLLVRFGGLRFSHPATAYIVFHVHTVTIRLAGLANGAPSLYSGWRAPFDIVRPDEIARAALYCDFAFAAVTVVWILVATRSRPTDKPSAPAVKLEPKILRPVLLLTLIGGVIGFKLSAHVPGVARLEGFTADSEWAASSYVVILPSWVGLAVLGHIYYYGFRWYTGILLTAYLLLMSIQGGLRFRVIVGLLLAVTIWVERKGRKWPSPTMVIGLAIAGLLFFPMKAIGSMTQEGRSFSDISTFVFDSFDEVAEGSAPDHQFLDEFASALTLLDQQDKRYYGSIYLPLLTLPIPRAWWPEKPRLTPFMVDISSRSRPMDQSGMIATYLGESYANLGLLGIFAIPPLLALGLAWFSRRAYLAPYDSLLRFSYVLLSVNLIQVFRDGLQSIVIFTFVNMMPLVIVVLSHLAVARIRRRYYALTSLGQLQARMKRGELRQFNEAGRTH